MIELSDYHQGFVAGWFPGFFMGIGLMKMAWDHSEQQRRKRRFEQPKQPLAADLIRYSRWRSEQIERALRDEPLPPAPITAEEWARRRSNRDDDRLDALQRAPIKPQFPSPRQIREDFLP